MGATPVMLFIFMRKNLASVSVSNFGNEGGAAFVKIVAMPKMNICPPARR